jgi:hypothetical protein
MVERRVLPVPPRMEIDKIAELWAMKEINRNYWRVAAWIDHDDLVQMIYFHWYRIVMGQLMRGPRQSGEAVSKMHVYKYVTDRRQIMALFQATFKQYLNDLANNRTNGAPFEASIDDELQLDCIDFGRVGTAGPASAPTPQIVAAGMALRQAVEKGAELDEEACIEIIDVLMSISDAPRNDAAAVMLGYVRSLATLAPHIFAPISKELNAKKPNSTQCEKVHGFFNNMRRRLGRHVRTSEVPRRKSAKAV